jgi:hypothetical protein
LPHVADLRHVKEPCDYMEVGSQVKLAGHFSPDSSTFRCCERSHWWGRGGIWRRKWERLKAGESNGKLPLRTCLESSVPETYRSPDWAMVPAKPAQGLNTNNNVFIMSILERYIMHEAHKLCSPKYTQPILSQNPCSVELFMSISHPK